MILKIDLPLVIRYFPMQGGAKRSKMYGLRNYRGANLDDGAYTCQSGEARLLSISRTSSLNSSARAGKSSLQDVDDLVPPQGPSRKVGW